MDAKILIRFDDICPTMDFKQFNRAVELLDKYNVKPLIGIIPNNNDIDLQIEKEHGDFWEYIKNLKEKGYAIAMHGYEHRFCSPHHGILNRRKESEFAGLPVEQQIDKIKKGKEILINHGIDTDIFFAPAHSYDKNTLKALSLCGFKYMSDGKSKKAYWFEGIKCLPCRNAGAANISGPGYYTSVFHAHEWVRPDKSYAFDQLKKTLDKYGNYVVPFGEYCNQPVGNALVQQLVEKSYVIWQCVIKNKLSKFYHTIKRG